MTIERERAPAAPRQPWTKPTLKYVGDVTDVLKGGTGKLSPTASDSGDIRKPPGQQ